MKRIIFIISVVVFSLLVTTNVKAALVTVNPQGQLVWQILGDESNLTVKAIAQNVTPAPNLAISLKSSDGKIELNGMDVTNLKETLVELQARGDTSDIKIGQENGKFEILENGVTATTAYPIVIDPAKSKLSITTATGDRLLGILPSEAVQSLIRGKFIDSVKDNQIMLGEGINGELGYEVPGVKNVNIFNIANVKADVTSTVSATSGEILKIDEPQWLKILGFLFRS